MKKNFLIKFDYKVLKEYKEMQEHAETQHFVVSFLKEIKIEVQLNAHQSWLTPPAVWFLAFSYRGNHYPEVSMYYLHLCFNTFTGKQIVHSTFHLHHICIKLK